MKHSLILLSVTLALLVGCGGRGPNIDPLAPQGFVVGESVKEEPIRIYMMGTGSDVVLVMATIHGNENAGTPLTMRLKQYLEENPALLEGKTVVLMPVANPDGYKANKRFNSRKVDLNRNFDAPNRKETARSGAEPLSEPESRAILKVLEMTEPKRIVSMHEPLACIDWDGPGEDLARHMGKFTDLKVEKLGSRPGSLGSYAGETLGIPIITLEFPKGAGKRSPEDLWADYGQTLLAAVTFPNDPPSLAEE
jgi:protein MpaA